MQLTDVIGYGTSSPVRGAPVKNASAPSWEARHGLTATDYQTTFDQLTLQGDYPVLVNGYATANGPCFTLHLSAKSGRSLDRPSRPDVRAVPGDLRTFDQLVGEGYLLELVDGTAPRARTALPPPRRNEKHGT
jgi:hypothetical protein